MQVNNTLILESFFVFFDKQVFHGNSRAHANYTAFSGSDAEHRNRADAWPYVATVQGRKGKDILHSFNIELYNKIVKYKTCLYSFYLPMVAALILVDTGRPTLLNALAVGTDLRDHKCS